MKTALFIAIVVLMVASILLGINRAGADADHRTPEPPPAAAALIPPQRSSRHWCSSSPPRPPQRPPATTAPPVTVPSKRPLSTRPEIEEIIRYWFAEFGQTVADQAVAISWCETGGTLDPTVVNASGHTGLFQISRIYHEERVRRLGFTWDQLTDPAVNAIVAADIYREDGDWRQWTCRWAA
jgi:hypothetical protein